MAHFFAPNHQTYQNDLDFITKLCLSRQESDWSALFEQRLDLLLASDVSGPANNAANEDGLIACFDLCERLDFECHERLFLKSCQLTERLTLKSHLTPSDRGLNVLVGYLTRLLSRYYSSETSPSVELILTALGALLFENGSRLTADLRDSLLGSSKAPRVNFAHVQALNVGGILPPLCLEPRPATIRLAALKCLRNILMKTSARVANEMSIGVDHAARCYDLFLNLLLTPISLPPISSSSPLPSSSSGAIDASIAFAQRMLACVNGLENCLLLHHGVHAETIGHLLASLKSFMFFGISGSYSPPPGLNFSSRLFPTPLSIPDAPLTMKEIGILPGKVAPSPNKKNRRRGKKNNKSQYAVATGDEKSGAGDFKPEQALCSPIETSDGSSQRLVKRGLNPHAPDFFPGAGYGEGAIYRHPNYNANSSAFAHRQFKLTSSESEFSDTEGGTLSKLRGASSALRQQCHATLYSVIKCTDRRVILGYWSAFLPDHALPTGPAGNAALESNLLVSILKDPSTKVRATAVSVLSYLLEGSKQYLAIADDNPKRRSASNAAPQLAFTPLSQTLSGTIHELHRALLQALASETNHIALTQILKCIASLVVNVPYYKLTEGLLTKVVRKVRHFVNHKEVGVKIASLTCLGSVLCAQNVVDEVHSVLMEKESSEHSPVGRDGAVESPSEPTPAAAPSVSWLARHCFNIVKPAVDHESRVAPLRIEALQLLGYMVRSHLPVLRVGIPDLVSIIKAGLVDAETSVQLHSAKLLEEFGRALLTELETANSGCGDLKTERKPSMRRVSLAEIKDIWVSMLGDVALISALQNMNEALIQASACDAIATMGPQVFQMLPRDKVVLCMTIPLGLAQPEVDPLVRAAAIRTLGVYIQYPTLREDVNFISDVGHAVVACLDSSSSSYPNNAMGQQAVRIKAAWAFGNLSESLFVNRETLGASFVNELDARLLLKLLLSAIAAAGDTDKVRANAVRAVGNLLRYLPEATYAVTPFKDASAKAVYSLIENIATGLMKVRWNACYALANMLRNAPLLVDALGASWIRDMVIALCTAVKECKNFKVRINAALALGVPKERRFYGSATEFATVWESLFVGLQNAEIVSDFSEVKYREVLIDQICMTLVHLVDLLTIDDLSIASSPLGAILDAHYDAALLPSFRQHGRRISGASVLDANRAEINDKMMAMANAETNLSVLKTSLKRGEEEDQKDDEEAAEIRLVNKFLTLFKTTNAQDVSTSEEFSFPPRSVGVLNFEQTFD